MTGMWATHASTCSPTREAPNRSVLTAAAGPYTPNRTRFGVGGGPKAVFLGLLCVGRDRIAMDCTDQHVQPDQSPRPE
jgi:hypothetical protein